MFLDDDDGSFYAYETPDGLRVPCFRTLQNAQLFGRELAQRGANVEAGGGIDLQALAEYADGKRADAPDNINDGWLVLLEVAAVCGRDDGLPSPGDQVADVRGAVARCLAIFRALVIHVDRAHP
jgi:hypothetical protein